MRMCRLQPMKMIPVAGAVALALGLGACISSESREAVCVLRDIEAGSAPSDLKDQTPVPERRSVTYVVDGRSNAADLYVPGQPAGANLVLVPGFTREGRDDPRVIDLASSLARARFIVLVPEIPGARDLRVRGSDARPVGDAVLYLAESGDNRLPIGIAAISYAVGPAIRATLMASVGDDVDFVVGLGSYHDTTSVITYMTTGWFRDGPDGDWQQGAPYPFSKWIFLASNAEALDDPIDIAVLRTLAQRRAADENAPIDGLVEQLTPDGAALLALMTNDDPARVEALLAEVPDSVGAEIEALSLAGRDLTPLAGRLILIHGDEDRMIPYTESRALAAAVGDVQYFEVADFSHIDPTTVGWTGQLTLIDAMQAVLGRRRFEGLAVEGD